MARIAYGTNQAGGKALSGGHAGLATTSATQHVVLDIDTTAITSMGALRQCVNALMQVFAGHLGP